MNNKKITIGQTLFKLNIGNAARRVEQKLVPVVVTKIGRKYFSIMEPGLPYTETQFNIKDMAEKTEYSPNYCLYTSEQEYEDEKESTIILKELRELFGPWGKSKNLSLLSLRAILSIVNEGIKDET